MNVRRGLRILLTDVSGLFLFILPSMAAYWSGGCFPSLRDHVSAYLSGFLSEHVPLTLARHNAILSYTRQKSANATLH